MKTQWYWVTGDHIKGFKIATRRPRSKFVREPFDDIEKARRFIAMEFLLNA